MVKKQIGIALFLGVIAVIAPLSAANISVMVMETARPGDPASNQYAALWENSLLEVFFDTGHIVSNSPITQIRQKPADGFPDEAERDFENAQAGGMDYFLITVVDYTLPYVSLRLFNTGNSSKMIQEQKHTIRTLRNTKEEQENIKKTIRAMAAYLN